MEENRIRIVSVEPGKKPIIEHINNSIETFHKIINDNITIVMLDDNISIVMSNKYNDHKMSANRKLGDVYIGGEFFLTGNTKDNVFVSLTDEQIHTCMNWFEEIPKWSGSQIATAKEYDKSENNMFLASQILQEKYLNKINTDILPNVDYNKLNSSYKTDEMKYAKDILNKLHMAFIEIYGTDTLDSSYEFVTMPAVIKGINTNNICIGLIDIDVSSSGEHWGTAYFTEKGVVLPFETDDMDLKNKIENRFVPYEYFYTPTVEGDIHIDGFNKTNEIISLLGYAYNVDSQLSDDELEEI